MPFSLFLLAAAVPATPLAPVGPWLVEEEENTCVLSHAYGTPAERIRLGFQPIFNQATMDVIAISQLGSKDQEIGDAKLIPGPDGAALTGSYSSVRVNDKPERFTRITTTARLVDVLRTASTLSIKAKPLNVTVRIVNFGKAMAAFDGCQSGLLKAWGVDPTAVEAAHAPRPHNLLRLFSSDSYPAEAVHSGTIGRVVTVLQVDATGTVTACRVVASAGKILNEGTCRQAMKVKFDPARGADDKPAPSIYVLPVRWLMP